MADKILFVLFNIALLAAPFLVYPPAGDFSTPKFLVLQISCAVMAAIWVVSSALKGSFRAAARPGKWRIALYLWLAWTALSCLYAPARALAWRDLANWLAFAVIGLFAGGLLRGRRRRSTLTLVAASGALAAVFACLQFYIPSWELIPGRQSTVVSTLGNPNYVAAYLLVCFPIALALFLHSTRTGYLIGFGFGVGAMALGILCAESRSAIILLGIVVFIQLSATRVFLEPVNFRRIQGKAGLAVAIVASVAVVFFAAPRANRTPPPQLETVFFSPQKTLSFRQRMMTWQISLMMAQDAPLQGVGLGNFKYRYPGYQAAFLHTPGGVGYMSAARGRTAFESHNDYLQMLAETGAVGLGLFLIFLGGLAAAHISLLLKFTEAEGFHDNSAAALERQMEAIVQTGLLCAAFAGLAHALVDFPLRLPASGAVLWTVFGLLGRFSREKFESRIQHLDRRERTEEAAPGEGAVEWPVGRPLGVVASLAALAGAGVLIYALPRPMLAMREIVRANEAAARAGVPAAAIGRLDRAIKFDPNSGDAWFDHGRFQLMVGRPEKAEADFLQALKTKDNSVLHFNLGLAFEGQRKLKEAMLCFERAAAIDPYFPDPHYRMAIQFLDHNEVEDAIGELELLARLDPTRLNYLEPLAVAYGMSGRIDSADAILSKLLQENPNKCSLILNKALVDKEASRLNDARDRLMQASHLRCPRAPIVRQRIFGDEADSPQPVETQIDSH